MTGARRTEADAEAVPQRQSSVGPVDQLVADAAALYPATDRFASRFARGKLTNDPLFATLLRVGAIPDASCLVDLGCGQGLLAAWLHTARAAWIARPADWPAHWPSPPKVGTYLGIDRSRADIARAHRALPTFARTFRGDLRKLGETLLDRCDVATLFDVLQYLAPPAQQRLLTAVHAGLPPWGVLVLRIGDGASTHASRRANAVDLVVCAARGQPQWRLHRRPLAEWTALLERIGFVVEVLDDERDATPTTATRRRAFANVLLRASRATPPARPVGGPASAAGSPSSLR